MSAVDGEVDSPFGILPPELVVKFFKKLDLSDKKIARVVCHRWSEILDDTTLPNYIFRAKIENNEEAKFLANCQREIESLEIKNVTKKFNSKAFPRIKEIILGENISGRSILTILECDRQNLETLEIDKLSFQNVGVNANFIGGLKFAQLNHLKFCVEQSYNADDRLSAMKHNSSLCRFFDCAKIPLLSKLDVNLLADKICPMHNHTKNTKYDIPIQHVMTQFYNFIARHTDTLKGMGFHLCATTEDPRNFPALKVSDKTKKFIVDNLKLECFSIHFEDPEFSMLQLLPCILEPKHLTTLIWCTAISAEDDVLENLISLNAATLTEIKILNFGFEPIFLKNCTALKSLLIGEVDGDLTDSMVDLPTVTLLDLTPYEFNEFDTWVAACFKNLEKIRLCTRNHGLSLDALKKLLELSKLQEIRCCFHPVDLVGPIRDHCLANGLEYTDTEEEDIYFVRRNNLPPVVPQNV